MNEVSGECICTFDGECSGTGVLHCSPPCGGDLCVCICGGEEECDGCMYCTSSLDDDAADFDEGWY